MMCHKEDRRNERPYLSSVWTLEQVQELTARSRRSAVTLHYKVEQGSPAADLILAGAIPPEPRALRCLWLSPALVVQHSHHHGLRGGPEADPALGLVCCCPTEKPAS